MEGPKRALRQDAQGPAESMRTFGETATLLRARSPSGGGEASSCWEATRLGTLEALWSGTLLLYAEAGYSNPCI